MLPSSSIPIFHSSIIPSLALGLAAPAGEAPEEEAEKEGAATVDAKSIPQFVGQTGVVLGVNADIVAGEQVGQGHRHHGSLDQTAGKTSRLRVAFEPAGDAMKQEAYENREGSDGEDAFNDRPGFIGGLVHVK